MGSKRSVERMEALHGRLLAGMAKNGVAPDVAEQIFDKLKAFADFGFPESHAYSFAYLVYASAWLKVHHPAAFYAGLLAAQPMGFYSPQSLVADARRHGVTALRPDVNASGVKAGVERLPGVSASRGAGVGTPSGRDVRPGAAVPRRGSLAPRSPAPPDGAPHPDLSLAVRMGLGSVRGVGGPGRGGDRRGACRRTVHEPARPGATRRPDARPSSRRSRRAVRSSRWAWHGARRCGPRGRSPRRAPARCRESRSGSRPLRCRG